MVAYIDDFKLMVIISLACMPLLLVPAQRRGRIANEPMHAIVE